MKVKTGLPTMIIQIKNQQPNLYNWLENNVTYNAICSTCQHL